MMRLLDRIRWLRAYKNDVKRKSGSLSDRRELARRFNARKFWFQSELKVEQNEV